VRRAPCQPGALRIHLTRLSTEGLGPRHGEVRRAHQMLNAALCLSVCLCVCLSVRERIFRTTRPIFTNIFVHVTYDRGSVLLWWRSDMLCTSSFTDDVIFAHKPRLLDVAAQLKCSAHAALRLAINCAQ